MTRALFYNSIELLVSMVSFCRHEREERGGTELFIVRAWGRRSRCDLLSFPFSSRRRRRLHGARAHQAYSVSSSPCLFCCRAPLLLSTTSRHVPEPVLKASSFPHKRAFEHVVSFSDDGRVHGVVEFVGRQEEEEEEERLRTDEFALRSFRERIDFHFVRCGGFFYAPDVVRVRASEEG